MADSKQINDGGHAFPALIGPPSEYATGMSLRDWFAGQAVAGICAGLCSDASQGHADAYSRVDFTAAGKDSYKLADVMIAARKGGA